MHDNICEDNYIISSNYKKIHLIYCKMVQGKSVLGIPTYQTLDYFLDLSILQYRHTEEKKSSFGAQLRIFLKQNNSSLLMFVLLNILHKHVSIFFPLETFKQIFDRMDFYVNGKVW